MARDTGLGFATLEDATDAMARFIDPVLRGHAIRVWDPVAWAWT
jgi:hypothetical protein